MGLLATVLLPLLVPQAPSTPAAPPAPAVAQATDPTSGPALLAALRAAEADDGKTDVDAMVQIATGGDAAAAARAAFLLARGKQPARLAPLQQIVGHSKHAEARVQAMQGLLRCREIGATPIALHALNDGDRRVRTLAAQLLGALKRPSSREPLLAVLNRRKEPGTTSGAPTDRQAALLALLDLGAHDAMLRAATSVHDSDVDGLGETLAYCLQQTLPKLDHDQQVLLALGLLEHREALVRRLAIGHLGELREAKTVAALEGRLAVEGPELRPLLEVTLAHVRADRTQGGDAELAADADLLARARAFWQQRGPFEQGAIAATPLVLLIVLMLALRRSRDASVALLSPAAQSADDPLAETDATNAFVADVGAEESQDAATDAGATEPVSDDVAAEGEFPEAAPTESSEELPADGDDPAFTATSTELEIVGDTTGTNWQSDAPAR